MIKKICVSIITALMVCTILAIPAFCKTLKFANPMPVSDKQGWVETIKPWGEAIEQRTNGKLKLKAFHSGSLINFANTPDAMEMGMADLAYFSTMFAPAHFPSWLFGGVLDPMTSPRNPFEGVMVASIMCDEFPSFGKELANKNMMLLMHNATALLSMVSSVEIPGIDELKGKRVRIFAGEFHAELTKLQGAAPVMTPWPDVYESMDKGIVDCMVTVTTGMRDLKVYEVAKYLYLMKATPDAHWVAPMNACYLTAFNLRSFKRLPVEQRIIVLEEAKKIEEKYARMAEERLIPDAIEEMKNGGLNVFDWPLEDVAKWGDISQKVYKMAIDEMVNKKLPGEKIVQRYLELTKTPSVKLRSLYEKSWANRIQWAKDL